MIKASELKIGSLVARKNHRNVDVIGIVRSITKEGTICLEQPDEEVFEDCDLYPVPLTNYWLTRFGIKNRGDHYLAPHEISLREENENSIGWTVTLGLQSAFHLSRRISFIHELQLLFFALTGEDLSLKHPS